MPMIVDTLVFDEGQITCPTNGLNPQWGGCCHALSGNAGRTVVIIKPIAFDNRPNYVSQDVAQSLTADGGQRNPVNYDVPRRDRMPESGSAPWLV